MKKAPEALESLEIRRARVADADKVRYRVYKTPTDFVAVIAGSALLALKAAGVKNPHKVVRDLPTGARGAMIDAARMAKPEVAEKVTIAQRQESVKNQLFTELTPRPAPEVKQQADFKRMTLGDLQRAGLNRARILSPEMLSEIIDEYSKVGAAPAPAAEVVEPALVPSVQEAESVTTAAPSSQASPPAPASAITQAPLPSEPQLSQEEKVMKLASEILPSSKDLPPPEDTKLSQDEVNKLLNE